MRLDKPSIITCFTAAHWRGNVSFRDHLKKRLEKLVERTWTINFDSRPRNPEIACTISYRCLIIRAIENFFFLFSLCGEIYSNGTRKAVSVAVGALNFSAFYVGVST